MSDDEKRVHRQALAGMLWSKQYYLFDVDTNFSDVTPPVHAWATLYLFHVERSLGREDIPSWSARSTRWRSTSTGG